MAEEKSADSPNKQLVLQKVYIKDLSFATPLAPEIFRGGNVAPQTLLNIKSGAKEVATETQEITLSLTVEAIDDDETPRARRVHELGRVRPRCQLDARGRTPPAVVALLRGN